MKNNITFLIIAFVLVAIIAFAADFSFNKNNKDALGFQNPYVNFSPTKTNNTPPKVTPPAPTTLKTPTPAPTPTPTTSGFTLAQVRIHSASSNCWSIVENTVYDLTPWINQHPGGAETILSMCGKDATDAFMAQHGGQRRPQNELVGFEIGVYKQ